MSTTILLVEDNPVTRKLIRFTLEQQDFSVIDAVDGAAALSAFAVHPVDLVLQDLILPDIDGFELVDRLRALPRGAEIPILACSGLMSKLEAVRMSTGSFDDVISKPVEPSRLVEIVRAHLPPVIVPRELFGAGYRLLLADDDAVQRKLLSFRLQRLGFAVETADDGLDALQKARQRRPDLIVSDVLMPDLDGFGLCVELRRDPALADIPLVLTTNSYVEREDRQLAATVGANALVVRTPELGDLLAALRSSLRASPPRLGESTSAPDIDAERIRRMMRQLERQVAMNSRLTQRCALLSAELAVINGIGQALATEADTSNALRQALAACLDAGGISEGALLMLSGETLDTVNVGASPSWSSSDLQSFFGERGVLDDLLAEQKPLLVPSEHVPATRSERLLSRARAGSILVIPLVHQRTSVGALLLASRTREMTTPDRVLFAQAVAAQIIQALAVSRAFERQRASERRATEQAAVLHSILDSLADAVVVHDATGAETLRNPAADQMPGIGAASQVHDGEAAQVLGGDQTTPMASADMPLARAVRGESVDRLEMFVPPEAGRERGIWLSVNARPWTDGSDTVRGGVAVFRDVTQQRDAQAQLMVSDRMASVGMLAAGVAHEINNPLTAVVANLAIARSIVDKLTMSTHELGDLQEVLDDAHVASDRVRHVVGDLRMFSRHEEVKAGPIDVRDVLRSSLRLAWNELRHRARLVEDFGDIPPAKASESRLGQVFLNLIVNAAQAIPAGDVDRNEIRLRTRTSESGMICVEISDTGGGIPPEVRSRLFTPFFTTKSAREGTGLGLAICRRIVTQMGGDIDFHSELGVGTTFRVLLPASEHTTTSQSEVRAAEVSARRRGRILIIDDEPLVAAALKRLLSLEHEVSFVTDAREALAMLRDGATFDVILCDLMMPQMTGMELHARLTETDRRHAARIVFLTGGAFTTEARQFLDEVPNPRMDKPFDHRRLAALINDRIE